MRNFSDHFDSLRSMVNLKTCIEEAQTVGSVRLFFVRHELPSECAKFKRDAVNSGLCNKGSTYNLPMDLGVLVTGQCVDGG